MFSPGSMYETERGERTVPNPDLGRRSTDWHLRFFRQNDCTNWSRNGKFILTGCPRSSGREVLERTVTLVGVCSLFPLIPSLSKHAIGI